MSGEVPGRSGVADPVVDDKRKTATDAAPLFRVPASMAGEFAKALVPDSVTADAGAVVQGGQETGQLDAAAIEKARRRALAARLLTGLGAPVVSTPPTTPPSEQ